MLVLMHPRIKRERETIRAMIGLYCRKHHDGGSPCPQCLELLEYADKRLQQCPFQEGKTTCARCPVHCYNPAMREKVRAVMRYAGPRMIYKHPLAALRHMIDGRRTKPSRPSVRQQDALT